MKHLFLILIAALFSCTNATAQERTTAEQHPIDLQQQACLDSSENQSTAGMVDCTGRAIEAWDKEMNKYYKLLMSILSPDEKAKLKAAQKNWLAYRDAELLFSGTTYHNLDGTMWRIVAVGRQLEIIKQRATELTEYYETLKENKLPPEKPKGK